MTAGAIVLRRERSSLPPTPLDRRMARAHNALCDVLAEVNASGMLMDPILLRRLHSCADEALRVAALYRRQGGSCGYGCPRPGLHCAVAEGSLESVTRALEEDGFVAEPDAPGETAITCVCGAPMGARTLRRGSDVRAWATCEWCEHWLALVG
jgi:hypothetical protein